MSLRANILAALGAGDTTARQVARRLGLKRESVSVELSRMADDGSIRRAGVENVGARGRPFVRWRRQESAA